ncbi:MAG: 3-deoxy-D-manno-octulosonic acid transferase [Desulfococcaceae bacterium]
MVPPLIRAWQIGASLGAAAAFPALLPYVLRSRKRRKTVLGRLALAGLPDVQVGPSFRRIWIHALSVGEVISAAPLVRAIAERFPERELFFSASTETGFAEARARLQKWTAACLLFPYDLPIPVRRMMKRIDPALIVIVETDIWPGFLGEAAARRIPVVLVNTRLSDRSFRGYRRISGLMGPVLRLFARICLQSALDAERFRALGVPAERIVRAGNLKFDQPAGTPNPREAAEWRRRLGLDPARQILVAGSTHEGEEAVLAAAFRELRRAFPDLALVIAPRSPDRASAVVRILADAGCSAATLAETEAGATADAVVVDRIGVLKSLYALGAAAFVGGSLVARGGHNPLEPAAHGVPVFYGPHMENFREIARLLRHADAAGTAGSAEEIFSVVADWLSRPEDAGRMGARGRKVFLENRGAVARTVDVLAGLLPPLPRPLAEKGIPRPERREFPRIQ